MLIEKIELTMSHVSLGCLNEYALMVIFGDSHSHHLVQGLTINPSQIVSSEGHELYPAYFMTRLRVPLDHLLNTFSLWENVQVGVDVKRFGETLLESKYILCKQDCEIELDSNWSNMDAPTMVGNNLIVNETMGTQTAKRQVANPNPDFIAELPRMSRSPEGLSLSKKVRVNGFEDFNYEPQFKTTSPIKYKVKSNRDAMQGHAMIFAKYAEIMDVIESDFLGSELPSSLSNSLINKLEVIERDIFYYGNCFAGEELSISLVGEIELNEEQDLDDDLDFIPAGFLRVNFEINQSRTGELLALSSVKKVFAIPMQDQELIADLRRAVNKF